MQHTRRLFAFLILLSLHPDFRTLGKDTPEKTPAGWGYVRGHNVEVAPRPGARKADFVLRPGALVGLWKWQNKQGTRWAQIHVVNLENSKPVDGWVDTSLIEELPFDKFPSDAELKRAMGGDFLDDSTASHTQITRFLVQQRNAGPALFALLRRLWSPPHGWWLSSPMQGSTSPVLRSNFLPRRSTRASPPSKCATCWAMATSA